MAKQSHILGLIAQSKHYQPVEHRLGSEYMTISSGSILYEVTLERDCILRYILVL